MSESNAASSWGRVDEALNVFVTDGDAERKVGQYPDGTPEEALAYFSRKYDDLAGQVTLLEQRVLRGTAGPEAAVTARHLSELLSEPNAVGDIEALRTRVAVLREKTDALHQEHLAAKSAAREESLKQRLQIVEQAEALAGQDLSKVQWKHITKKMDELFAQWQSAQKSSPSLSKAQGDELWKRFRHARQNIDTARRNYFSQMDATNKDVRARKTQLITEAQALEPKGADGIAAYRALLEKWKQAGHASRKVEDQLWAQFKAAGDVLYAAKSELDAIVDVEFTANLDQKLALLKDHESLMAETDHAVARERLLTLQKKWDAIGKVPRASMREIEAKLKRIEDHVRSLHDKHWTSSNPETVARSEGLKAQLEKSIADLERSLAEATAEGDSQAISSATQALETQRSWLAALDS